MKKLAFFFYCIFLTAFSYGQSADSLQVVKARWEKQKLGPGVFLYQHHFNDKQLFTSNQFISFIEFKNNGKRATPMIAASPKELIKVADFAMERGALAGINGTFFDVKNGGSVDFIKVDGRTISETRLEQNGKRARHQKAAILIDQDRLSLAKWDGSDVWESLLPAANVMLSGPLLTYEQREEVLDSAAFNSLRHPRSAIGILSNGKVILLTVDGRHENSAGMSLFELRKLMQWLGCVSAINLDGGGSTTLWASGSVVNYPSDNKQWDHEGARKVADSILIKKKNKSRK